MSKNHLSATATALIAVAAALIVAACGRDQVSENTANTGVGAHSGAALGKSSEMSSAAKDMGISAEVKTRLANDGALGTLEIQVQTTEGRVLLRGITPDTDVRRQAAELARTVDGVVDVKNDLSVQVPHR